MMDKDSYKNIPWLLYDALQINTVLILITEYTL